MAAFVKNGDSNLLKYLISVSVIFETSCQISGHLMLDKNVFQWTAKILSYTRKGFSDNALSCFLQMRRNGLEANDTTFSTTLTACANSLNLGFGSSLHGLIFKLGSTGQLFVSSGLIRVYSKCDRIEDARKVFDEMPERDGVVWNSMISGCSQNGLNEEAVELFSGLISEFRGWKRFVNDFTLASTLKACAGGGFLRFGQLVHNYAIKMSLDSNIYVGASVIDMYCKCEKLDSALRVFDRMRDRDVVVWNTIISGCALNEFEEEAIQLFQLMESNALPPNENTLSCVLNASQVMPDSAMGRCFHVKALKLGFLSEVYVGTAVIDMYSKFLAIDYAERAFDEMIYKNVVSYNALISGYSLNGGIQKAKRAYMALRMEGMVPDPCTYVHLFSCFAASRAVMDGTQVHSQVIVFGWDSDASVGNSLINFYSNCGFVDCALKVFETMQDSNIVSWSAIISGLVQNNKRQKAFEIFCELNKKYGVADEFSSSNVIKSAAAEVAIEQGKQLHAYVIKRSLQFQIVVGSALVDMYSKCGMVEDAYKVFCKMPEKNVISWNSMVMGYAQNGFADEALLVFQEMKNHNLLPTPVTFVGVLVACCHAGYVEEGKQFYKSMVQEYQIPASIEHNTCMVNLLGRAGYVEEAEALLLNSPYSQDAQIWRSLLASCEAHRNLSVAVCVAKHCVELEPNVSSTYTILSNIYAAKKMWSEVSRTRDLMLSVADTKEPGCSWIEARN